MRASVAALAALAMLCLHSSVTACAQGEPEAAGAPSAPLRKSTMEEHRLHLQALQKIVQICSTQRDAAACNPDQVGPDEEVAAPAGPRQVHYTWLRTTLLSASGKAQAAATSDAGVAKGPSPKEIADRLAYASERLMQETSPSHTPATSTEQVRTHLDSVLAQREFSRIEDPGLLARAQAKAWQWIFERLTGLASFGGRNPWLARLLERAAIWAPCVLLLWWIMVRLRRPDVSAPPSEPGQSSAPSAREWQRWMQEAEVSARGQQWREAVHHVYWAAISRMESQGLWPADRARTPREYLALLHQNHVLQPDLRRLTRSFERIWYGHRAAKEQEYREACAMMERLSPK